MLKDACPCPFCGSVLTDYEHLSDSDEERIRVYCSDCDVAGPSGGNLERGCEYHTEEEIEIFNKWIEDNTN